jgi:hypothetical protein
MNDTIFILSTQLIYNVHNFVTKLLAVGELGLQLIIILRRRRRRRRRRNIMSKGVFPASRPN